MKIDVSILWIDDNKNFVESLRPQLVKWMETQGLDLQILWHPGEAGIYDDLQKKDVELIVMDYKLKGQRMGDAIIRELRSREIYEDVIFYTTKVPSFGIIDPPLDGVLFVDREDAKEHIKKLFQIKIRRASDLATVRGWIVADAIELETLLGDVLCKCFKDMRELFEERVFHYENLFDLGKKCNILIGIVKDRIAAINDIKSKAGELAHLQACKKVLDLFPDEIILVRNTLAHQVAEVGEDGVKKLKTRRNRRVEEVTFTPDDCVVIRKNIRKHYSNLKALDALV